MGGKVYSTLAYSLWNYFTVFFDYIPKIMYFLYAAVASCLDAMQLLMRRLAGLDVYYVNMDGGDIVGGTGEAVSGDPVMEFIYGILGIGENAGSYQALNTTFWSLAIFAVIVLVVSTMIALIKSHYQEDGAKTAPLQYIYTAIKAILTFCIVPFAVIIGLMTSNFLLSTLDSITAGSGTEEAIVGIYGPQATNLLNAHTDESGHRYYSRYDFFGFGEAANSTTFSGALFKAAGYEANRVRIGEIGEESGGSWTDMYTFSGLFGPGSSGYAAATDKREYVAYQIDYAFQNNLDLNAGATTWAPIIYGSTDVFLTIVSVDVFSIAGIVTNFSKYNVGLVWCYYNLWKFNFMVGIASIIVCFGIFISIIIGLMSRLIKSIILFLIYAPTLGLAPMDDFGAFKKWRTEFIQQILMAFGSVIGMNIFFLVLPYINNIAFFNIYLIDAIVSVVVMVTGLMIIKSLISFFSGLVGGADALKEGSELKSDVGKTLASSAKWTMRGAGLAMRTGMLVAPAQVMAGKAIKGGIARNSSWALDKLSEHAENKRGEYNSKRRSGEDWAIRNDAKIKDKFDDVKDTAIREGKSTAEAEEIAREAIRDDVYDFYQSKMGKGSLKERATAWNDYRRYKRYDQKTTGFEVKREARGKIAEKIREANYLEEKVHKHGLFKGKTFYSYSPKSARHDAANSIRNAGGSLQHALAEASEPIIKKLSKSIADAIRFSTNKKYDEEGNLKGHYWAPKDYNNPAADRVHSVGPGIAATLGKLVSAMGGNYKPDEKKPEEPKDSEALMKEMLKELKKFNRAK